MTSPIDQIRRRGERALHRAAQAIRDGDIETKIKANNEAAVCNALLKAAGEPALNVETMPLTERCEATEDLFQ